MDCEVCKKMLSQRESDVLRAVCNGLSNKQISDLLKLSEKTVKNHVSRIFQKLHVTSRVSLVIYAIKNNIIALEEITCA